MIPSLPPGTLLVVGALIIPLLRGRWQQGGLLLLPAASAAHLIWFVNQGPTSVELEYFGYQLTPIRVDRMSLVWGYIFHIAAFANALYALHVKDTVQHVSALFYAGAAIGAVFAGDLITLFVYWELTAVSSVFLIWATRTERAYHAGMRYLVIQVGSGVLLLAGVVLHYHDTGSLAFLDAFHKLLPETDGMFLGLNSPGTVLIFLAFGIKAAFPLLHTWLADAYPEATPTGTVFLSSFTTKLAIYTLARGFPGTEALIWIGAAMAVVPIFYSVIENDLRRVLVYCLNNQLGFMVAGIGVGTALALNGTAAQAFSHILYKGLLFMTVGAVLTRTGTAKGSELGGLYKSMPWTTGFCLIGAASISTPLFCGFVSKSMILSALAKEHHELVWLILLFASAAVFHQSGIRVPFVAFFSRDSRRQVKEAPVNMLLAMALVSALCIAVGVMPGPLYDILPYEVSYSPYDVAHVVNQFQLLLWSALAFAVMKRWGVYPPELLSINLDVDWTYRKALPAVVTAGYETGSVVYRRFRRQCMRIVDGFLSGLKRAHDTSGVLAQTWSISGMVIWAAVILVVYLLLYYQ